MTRPLNVAVLGATGAVGREILNILSERRFAIGRLTLLASPRSEGVTLEFGGESHPVRAVAEEHFKDVQLVLASPGSKISARWAPVAAAAGAVMVDNSSHFRMDPDVPLVVPEVNPEALQMFTRKKLVANPNCSTIQMVLALKPLHDAARIKRVVVSTYQAVSGAGHQAMEEMEQQVRDLFNCREVKSEIFPKRIAFNVIPAIPQKDAFDAAGHSGEETKMVKETVRILGDENIRVSATCVRVPVFNGHAESVNVEFERPLAADAARDLLRAAPGVAVFDDPANMLFPTPLDVAGEDLVLVGRLRADPTVEHGLNMFVVGDNLRKGAALNAVQIAELLARDHLGR